MKKKMTFNLLIVSMFLDIISLPIHWYTFIIDKGARYFIGTPYSTTGLNSSISLFYISIPHWLLILSNIIISLTIILLAKKIVEFNEKLLYFFQSMVLIWLFTGGYVAITTGGYLGAGLIFMVFASLFNIVQIYYIKNK